MKMQLLIVNLSSFISCDTTLSDDVRVDDYEFHSIYVTRGSEKEISIQHNIDIISNIKYAKKIKGPIKSKNGKVYPRMSYQPGKNYRR